MTMEVLSHKLLLGFIRNTSEPHKNDENMLW